MAQIISKTWFWYVQKSIGLYIYAIMSQNYIKSIQKCKKYKRYLLIAWIKFGNIKDDQAFCI